MNIFLQLGCTIISTSANGYHSVPFGTIRYDPVLFRYNLVRLSTIRYHLAPAVSFGIIWYHSVQFGTIRYHLVPYGPIKYHPVPLSTIWYHSVPFNTIRYHLVPFHSVLFGTILVGRVPFGTIGYHMVPLSIIGYQFRWQGKVWERFGEFEVCQEADGD